MRWRCLLGAGVVLAAGALAGPVSAQSARDAEFAKILLQKGFLDLAEREARRIENDPSYSAEIRGTAGYLLVRVIERRARQSTDPRQRQELLDLQRQLIEEMKRKYPGHAMSSVADLEELQVRLAEAEARLAAAEEATEPAEGARLREEAVAAFEEALERFDAVIEELNQRAAKAPGDEELEYKRDLAEYLRANAWFTYARALPEGEGRRQEALQKAHELFQRFFEERGAFFNLWVLAYLGRGRAELELGRLEDAEATFGEALYLEVPFRHPNPERHAELVQFVLDAKAEAYYWLLVSQVRARRFEAAVETFRRMTQQFPQGKDTHFGKLAVLTYGKALAGLGRYTEAGEAIQQVLDAAMRSEKVIPGYDIDPYGVSACKTLAEIAEQTTGFFPAPLQYRAGQGFIFKRELEKATWALKGVLAGARTERERQTWGPRALLDLAIAYERLGRLYEAALAYQGLYRMFPDDARADRALRLARQRYQELAERDRWFRALADEVTRDIQVRLSGIGAEKAKYNQAVEWQRQGRYADAARKFLEVQPEIQQGGKTIEVDFYGSALANAGYCFFLAAREASGALAEGYRQQAEQALHKAFTFGQQRGEPGAQAAAAYYLALMEASEERAAYEQALERLQAFQGPLAADRVYRDRALGLMVHCLLRLGRLAEAERTLQALRQDFPQSDEVASRAFQLGDAYAREAARHTDARDRAAALTALRGASRWLRLWLEGNPDASFEHRAWVGNLVFRSGDFKAAAAILEGAVRAGEAAELSPAQREALVLPYARLQLAICLHRAGQHERALEQLERAAAEFRAAGRDPQEEYLYASARSDALFALWQQRRDAARLQELKAAHEAYWQLLDRLEEDGWQALAVLYELPYPSYFVAKLEADARLLEIYLGLKQWRFVHNQIEQMLELGKLDDVVHTRTRGDVIGRIESEGAEGVTVRTARGETVVVAAEEVSGIERVPPELRQRFLQMQERARQEGGL